MNDLLPLALALLLVVSILINIIIFIHFKDRIKELKKENRKLYNEAHPDPWAEEKEKELEAIK